ncbi:unnamed protein product [Haemonchus placei]|uniref:2-(3-amino-3-carboxypropyl)histidine synthase subunit 2 n=1 Tax=Haemonchus placei TaxID=6290 RepID=A0A0N4WUS6_HAEPC|nr:unnamed protein product [Haemonchus placei]
MALTAEEPMFSTSQFFSDRTPTVHPRNLITNSANVANLLKSLDDDKLYAFFNVEETVRWIRDNGYKRVALQLSDQLLGRAARVARAIESKANVKVFILADTSCCVDEVAAAHASCDAIAHYGDACLSALAENIPVRFFFGNLPVDLVIFREHVRNYLTTNASTSLLLLTDVLYSEKIDELENCIRQEIPKEKQLFRADVVDPTQHGVPAMHSSKVSSLGRVVPQGFCETAAAQVCFVGDPTSALIPLWLMTYPQCSSIVCFDPQTAATAEHE